MKKIMLTVCDLLEKGKDFAMATILTHVGSTPRTAGTKMIICPDGSFIGTIGGGLVEAQVQLASAEVIKTNKPQIRVFDLAGEDVERTDLICGGGLEILIEYVAPTPSNLQVFQGALAALQRMRRSYLLTNLGQTGQDVGPIERFLVLEDGSFHGKGAYPGITIHALISEVGKQRHPVILNIENQRVVVEQLFVPGTVYLFGAGHVSQQVAPLAGLVDFRTVVLDDRSEFANRERFPDADEIVVLSSFEHALQGMVIDADSYMVIVTRGHRHDKTVLEQALNTEAGYIGMIGSRRKRDKLYAVLLTQGFSEKDLERIHSPIGLNIAAETPEEIGVSIVSELIKIRGERKLCHENG